VVEPTATDVTRLYPSYVYVNVCPLLSFFVASVPSELYVYVVVPFSGCVSLSRYAPIDRR